MFSVKKYFAVLSLFVLSSIAHATPITFSFTGGPLDIGDPIQFSSGGLDLDVSGTPGVAVDNILGLGVVSGLFDLPEIDSIGPNESLDLDFSESVKLLEIGFSLVDFDDSGILEVNGIEVLSGNIPGDLTTLGFGSLDVSGFDYIADNFSFTVDDAGFLRENSYMISYLTVETLGSSSNPIGVPEPAPFLLMGLGLFVLGTRKKAL